MDQRQAQADGADGDGEEEREGQNRTDDFLVEVMAVVLLLDDRARVYQLSEPAAQQGIGDLEAENLQAAGG